MTAIAIAQQMCDAVHVYGFANGTCNDACYHFHECGPAAEHEVNQSNFYNNVKASGGFHNFSAQVALRCHRPTGTPLSPSLATPQPLHHPSCRRKHYIAWLERAPSFHTGDGAIATWATRRGGSSLAPQKRRRAPAGVASAVAASAVAASAAAGVEGAGWDGGTGKQKR